MENNIIAKVRIAPGEIGYYDEVSGVHLNQSRPVAEIKAGTNCSVLRRSVKCRRLILLEGSLGRPKTLFELLHPKASKQKMIIDAPKKEEFDNRKMDTLEVAPKAEELAKETKGKEKAKVETVEVPAEAEEKVEEAPAEDKPKKAAAKKSTTKKKAAAEE